MVTIRFQVVSKVRTGAELAETKTDATHACGQTGVLIPRRGERAAESTKDGTDA